MSRFTAPILSLALFGCAANRHLHAGDDFAVSGEWASALREYQEAEARRPHNEVIAGLVDEARAKAVADYLDAAGSALQGDDLAAAHDALEEARALQPGIDEVAILEDRLVAIGLARVHTFGAARQTDDAYRLAVRLSRWYGGREEVARALRDERSTVRAQATALADQERFAEAVTRLDVIGEQEPQFGSLEPWRAELRARWADDLVGEALTSEKAGRIGSAYLATAAAVGLAGRPEDAMLRDRLRGALVADYGLVIDLDVTGDMGGRAAIERAVDARVASNAVSVGDFAQPDLAIDVSLASPRFDEVVTTSVGEQPYIAAWDQVPNPAYLDQRAAVGRIEGYVFDRELELRQAREGFAVARHGVEVARTALEPLESALSLAGDRLVAVEQVESTALEALRAAQVAFEAAREASQPLEPVAEVLKAAREAYLKAHARADEVRTIETAARTSRDAANAALAAAEQQAAEQQRAVYGCETALARTHGELIEARHHLDDLQPYVEVARWDTFRYAIDHVERTAAVAVSVRTGGSTTRATGLSSTSDDAHGAFIPYGLAEDPLRFAASDADLVAAAWSVASERAAGAVDAEVVAWREGLVRDALASDGEAAARSWALVALADPSAVPPEFQRYLDVRWTGVSAAWVR